MVKCSLDAAAQAIASGPRRAIIDRLALQPSSMSELAQELGVTLPAIDKHVHVLLDGGLVTKEKHGRKTVLRLRPGSLDELATWAMSTHLMWSNLLDRFEQHVTDRPDDSEEHR